MSLETVLQIGKILRKSENSLKYFKYVEPLKPDSKGRYTFCITIPVKNDFSFDWNSIKITPENQRDKLYYLKFKTSDSDTSAPKYIFGDIFYNRKKIIDRKGCLKKTEEKGGNYIIDKSNAFENAEKTRQSFIASFINPNSNKLSKKEKELLSSLSEYIIKEDYSLDKNAEKILKENDLLKFWKSFYLNKDKIERCLIYSPIITKDNINNIDLLKNEYSKFLYENKNKETNKIFKGKDSFEKLNNEEKEQLSKYADHSVFVHFDFNKKFWYENKNVFNTISQYLNGKLTQKQNDAFIVPIKNIYRTLCSGDDKNDIQFPLFDFKNSYKSFSFKDDEDFNNFLFADLILKQPIRWLYGTNIGVYVFPVTLKGDNISAVDYEKFFFDKKDETKLLNALRSDQEPLFSFLENESSRNFTRFDFVFADSSGNTTKDLIEISGIERSKLLNIRRRIEEKEREIAKEKKQTLGWEDTPKMIIERSFSNLLGKAEIETENNVVKVVFKSKNKKGDSYPPYKSHLIKVIPLIYTDNYCSDNILLRNLIQKVEFSVRSGHKGGNYSLLKYDIKLLLSIQNNKTNKYMEITNSESYQVGLLLGTLAKNLSREINSFEKNYVGNLTRRISNLSDFIKLKTDIEQKLIMHDKAKYTFQTSYDLAQKIKEFKSQYDKEECAFGFMESYFKPLPKKEENESTEK